jgi:hypothetical protein
MKATIVTLLTVIASVACYFVYENEYQKRLVREVQESAVAQDRLAASLKKEAERLAEEAIQKAVKEKRVVKGMTKRQVFEAWNRPIGGKTTGGSVDYELRRAGVYEVWHYNNSIQVCFNDEGVVVAVLR